MNSLVILSFQLVLQFVLHKAFDTSVYIVYTTDLDLLRFRFRHIFYCVMCSKDPCDHFLRSLTL